MEWRLEIGDTTWQDGKKVVKEPCINRKWFSSIFSEIGDLEVQKYVKLFGYLCCIISDENNIKAENMSMTYM